MARQHPACKTCTCAETRPAAGTEALDHNKACIDSHARWWRIWEAKGTYLPKLAQAASDATAASRSCLACKVGQPAPGRGRA